MRVFGGESKFGAEFVNELQFAEGKEKTQLVGKRVGEGPMQSGLEHSINQEQGSRMLPASWFSPFIQIRTLVCSMVLPTFRIEFPFFVKLLKLPQRQTDSCVL